jgi:hypothetical protein
MGMGNNFFSGRQVTDFRDIPDDDHYAILQMETHREYDGYGDYSSVPILIYRVWTDHAEWSAEVKTLVTSNKPFRAIHVTPARIKVEVNIGIE